MKGALPGGQDRPRRTRGRARRAARWAILPILAVTAGIAVTVAAALAALQTDWGRQQVLTIALGQVNARIRGEVQVDRLEGHLPFDATLVGVRLRDPWGNEAGGADRVEVHLSLPPLLSRTVHLWKVRIEGVHATLRDGEGRLPVLDAVRLVTPSLPGPPSSSRWTFQLPDVRIEGSVARDPGPEAPGLRDVRITASLRYGDGSLTWAPLVVQARPVHLPAEDVHLESSGDIGPSGGRIRRLIARAGPQELALHGEAVLGEPPSLDLAIDRAHLDLDRLPDAPAWHLARPLPVRGVIDLTGSVAGPLDALRIDLDLATGAGVVRLAGTGGIRTGEPSLDVALSGQGIRPGRLVPSLPADLAIDLGARLAARGNPLETGLAEATVSIVFTGGPDPLPQSVDLRASVLDGWGEATLLAAGRQGQDLVLRASMYRPPPGLVDVRLVGARIDVQPLALLAGRPGYQGILQRLEARARVRIPASGYPDGSARLLLDAKDLRTPPEGGPTRIDRLRARIDAAWTGRGPPTGRARVDLGGVRVTAVTATRIDADVRSVAIGNAAQVRGTLGGRRLRYGRQVSVDRFVAPLDLRVPFDGGPPSGQVRIEATGLAAGPLLASGVRLDVQGFRTVPSPGGAGIPAGRLTGHLDGVELPGRSLRRIDLEAQWDRALQVGIHATGTGDRFSLEATATARLPIGGKRLSGDVRHLELVADGYGVRLQPGGGIRLGPGGRISAQGLHLGGPDPGTRGLAVSGTYDGATQAVHAEIAATDLDIRKAHAYVRDLVGGSRDSRTRPPRGTLRLRATLDGTLAQPKAGLEFDVRDLGFEGLSDLRAAGSATLDGRGLIVDATAASADGALVEVHANAPVRAALRPFAVRFARDQPARVEAAIRDFDLADVQAALGELAPRMRGRMDARLLAEGPLDRPRGSVDLTLQDAALDKLRRVSGRVQASLDAGHARAVISMSGPREQSLNVDADAPLDLRASTSAGGGIVETLRRRLADAPLRVSARMNGVRTAELPIVAHVGGGMLADAILGADLSLTGTLRRLEATGRIEARNLQLGTRRADLAASIRPDAPGAIVEVSLTDQRSRAGVATARVELPGGLGRLTGGREGLEPLLRDPRLQVRMSTDRLPVSLAGMMSLAAGRALATLVPGGQVTATIDAKGGGDGFAGKAEVRVEPPQGKRSQQGLARSIRIDANLSPHRTELIGKVDQPAGGGDLELTARADVGSSALTRGTLPGNASIPLTAHLAARTFRLDQLSVVLPSIFGRSQGVLDADLHVDGTTGSPRITGGATATFADLSVAPAGLRVKGVSLDIRASPDRLELTPIHLASGGGTLDLALALEGTSPGFQAARIEGRVAMKRFRLLDRRDARVRLTGELALGGTLGTPEVRGRIQVDDGRISPDIGGRKVHGTGLPMGVVFVGEEPPGEKAPAASSPRPSAVIDLSVAVAPRALRVKNDMVDVFLSADLAIRTREEGIALKGIVTVVRGTLELYGRTFKVEEDSSVVFDGSADIDPRLQVKADYDMRDVDLSSIGLQTGPDSRITVEVSGTARKPELKFQSDPPMADTDIVAVIALGAPMGAGAGQMSNVTSQTTNLVAGLATGALTRLLKAELPIDVFQVGDAPGTEGGTGGTEITVGKRITRDLLVLYKANIGTDIKDRNRNEVDVEYDITRYLEVRTGYGDAGQGGLDLFFRWRY